MVNCPHCHYDYVRPAGYGGIVCPPCWVQVSILQRVQPGDAVLDVGSGLAAYHPALYKRCGDQLAFIEAHLPYVVEERKRGLPPDIIVHVGEAERVLAMLRPDVFAWVIAVDFIEHLEFKEAARAVGLMKHIASKGVLLFTPKGLHPQDKDHYDLGGDYWQTHRSSWVPADLESLGFSVEVWAAFHAASRPESPDALWAEWRC